MSFPSFMPKPNWLSLKMLGLKVKLHIVNCEVHPDEKVLEFFDGPTAYNLDFEIEQPSEIYENLSKSLYMRYSAITILINCDCLCRTKILLEVLNAIQANKYLQHKFKLIYASYNLKMEYKSQIKIWPTYFEKHVRKLESETDLAKEFNIRNQLLSSHQLKSDQITFNDQEPLRDYFNFVSSKLENVFFFQLFQQQGEWLYRAQEFDYIFYIVDCLPLISAQELLKFVNRAQLAVHCKANSELYFYNINPGLAVINNNYIFTNVKPGISTREGSEKDVLKLVRELKVARIPYILIEDFSRDQLLDFVKYLSNKNLKALKSLIFIMMSHATANNIIYTHDGELNFIDDILLPLQSNETLQNTHISCVNVHCRGGLNALNSDPDEFDEIQPTQIKKLHPNNTVFYSVPDLVISPRLCQNGTPFVDSFCKSFRDLSPETDVRTFVERTWQDLRNDAYYSYLDCFDKTSELVVGDDTKSYCIKPAPTGAREFITLVETIEEEFYQLNQMKQRNRANLRSWLLTYLENLQKKDQPDPISSESAITSFCICANVNERKIPKNLDELKYFAPDLDEDTFAIEGSSQ